MSKAKREISLASGDGRLDGLDRDIMIYRALGYKQDEMANIFRVSQSTISLRVKKIFDKFVKVDDLENVFWDTMLDDRAKEIIMGIIEDGEESS